MRIKTGHSTAQRLGDYREAWKAYYRGLRSTNERTNRPLKPANTFPMNLGHLTERIEAEELKLHEIALREAQNLKEMTQ